MKFPTALASLLALTTTTAAAMPSFGTLYVFGDSLSDTGNLFAATLGTVPDPAYYDQGRFQNGPSYAEHLWDALALPGDLLPRIYAPIPPQGTNYAVGGARSRYSVLDVDPVTQLPPALGNAPTPFSLLAQVAQYQADFAGSADPSALHVVWSGANDITDILTVSLGDPTLAAQYLAQSVGDLELALDALLAGGARNLLVPNLPDIGVTPEILGIDQSIPGFAAAATATTSDYNQLVDFVLQGYAGIPGLEIFRVDTFSFLRDLVADPAAFGFTNASDPCLVNFFVVPPPTGPVVECANPDDYVFWDVFHPSAAAHRTLGDLMIEAVPVPAPLTLMVMGLAGMAVKRRRRAARL